MMRSVGSRSRRERGAAAVEFAIIFPLLFLVIAGLVDFGRFFFDQIQLTNAAREGARAAIVMASNNDVIARAAAATGGVPSVTVSVAASCTSGSTSNASVVVQAPFNWLVLGPAMTIIGKANNGPAYVSSTGVMRCGG
jgi:Flp pilus assembly protein TadG